MSTSLAQQLQKLALPQTNVLKKDHKRASILFDPKEAAGIRRETYFQIGLQGLEELILKNSIFEPFRNTLFNINAKSFERSVHDKEANQKLDKAIKKLLFLLSPYFLLNSTHKVLEWLVYRYMINEFNRNDLITLILPYHESNIFIRVVQILNFKDQNDPLYFLRALQKRGVHLTKQNLLNHLATNVGFLKFVSDFLPQLIQAHENQGLLTVIFNFYCTAFCGAIEYRDEVTETQVSYMLPLLLKGLKSATPDYAAASYIIAARLTAKTTLSNKLLDRMVELVSKLKCSSLRTESCLALVIFYQSQRQYLNMPSEALLSLCELEWFPKCLQYLCSIGTNIDSLAEVLIKRATEEGTTNDMKLARELIDNMLKEITFEDDFIERLLSSFLDALNKQMKYAEEIGLWVTSIVQDIETKYPAAFDETVKEILVSTSTKIERKRKSCLQTILRRSVTFKGRFVVLEKLYHPVQEIRAEAIKYVLTNHKTLKPSDLEFVKNILIDILGQKDVTNTLDILKVIEKMKIADERLDATLTNLLKEYATDEGEDKDIMFRILKLLCGSRDFNWKIFLVVFPFMWPRAEIDLADAKRVVALPFFSKTKTRSVNLLLKSSDVKSFTGNLLQYLSEKENAAANVLDLMRDLPARDYFAQYCCAQIASRLLTSSENIAAAVKFFYSFYVDAEQKSFKKKPSFRDYLVVSKRKFPVRGITGCIWTLLGHVDRLELTPVDFGLERAESLIFENTAALLFDNFDANEDDIDLFLNRMCKDAQQTVESLLNLCTSHPAFLNPTCVANIMRYVDKLLPVHGSKTLLSLDSLIAIHLLILMQSPDEHLRRNVVDMVERLNQSSQKSNSYVHLVEGLLAHREEIVMDHNQTPIVVGKLLSQSNRIKAKKQLQSILSTMQDAICSKRTPMYTKQGLVSLLAEVKSFEFFESTSSAIAAMMEAEKQAFDKFEALIFKTTIDKIDVHIAERTSLESDTWKLILTCLSNDRTEIIIDDDEPPTCLTKITLQHFTKDVLSHFTDDVLVTLLDIFCTLCVTSKHPDVITLVGKIFKHIDLDVNVIAPQLIRMRDVQSDQEQSGKRNRRINIPSADILETTDWKKGNVVLEFVQNKKKIRNAHCLLAVVSELLKKCLDFEEQAAVEYTKQLLLSLVLLISNRIDKHVLSDTEFNVDLVVQCIRSSQNPQTHHHAMLLLAYLAEVFPDKVLHHIMSIFTFMGSSLLRHDDAYSFQIIMKIVDIIVPIFLQSNQLDDLVKVLRVFVDALLDVPEHRRLPLYRQLLQNVNAEENMYLFLLVIFDSHVMEYSQNRRKLVKGVDANNKRLDITRSLCCEFPPRVTLMSCVKVIQFLKEFPVDTPENNQAQDQISVIINITNYSVKQLRHYKYAGISFLSNLLSSQTFVNQVALLSVDNVRDLEQLFKDVIVGVLTFIQATSKLAEKYANTPQAQYWKIILHHSYDILDGVNALLTPPMFLLVEKGLLSYNLPAVKRRALELLNAKLHNDVYFFKDCEKKDAYVLIPVIMSIVAAIDDDDIDSEQEVLIQTALLSLKLFVKAFSSEDPEKFVEILKFITNIVVSRKAQNNVLASVLLCLAESCVHLKAHAISSLADFMPAFLDILKSQKHQETSNLLLLSVVTATQKLIESLPLFLSPYLKKILTEVSVLVSRWSGYAQNPKLQPFLNKLDLIKRKLGTLIPLRVLLPAAVASYGSLIEKNRWKCVGPFMDILAEGLRQASGADIATNLPALTSFFLNALEFRGRCGSEEEAGVVEREVIKTLLVVILKLSEQTFRPLFYKIYEWASHDEDRTGRLITFYNLSKEIANSLKSLFVLFAGHFINNAVQLLDSVNRIKTERGFYKNDDKDVLLLEYVLETLQATFKFDNHKFVNKDRFDIIMQPLVDQLENTLDGVDKLVERNEKILTPTIVHFVVATAEDSIWKQANYQILLKMRHSLPQIRLAALHCLTQVVIKLGEDFLPLLPETIPFLAELLEDEEENVEKACQKAVQEMEKILGEPLQKYF
ncbi:HEAT repeat-containing protein 1 [Cylas formicarius]|uniref:HEAT repeat-containing protein 1 n=1 Tax=Cylas formicarius TaxID=197179 RepID=UPI002958B328|nr:HEAT repeat-containing protein 1 [Cylas formicarius]XP_060517603.1 HEAT repeat-containing protein 1 [Cylas formicarius]